MGRAFYVKPSDTVVLIKIDGKISFQNSASRIIESIAALANTSGGRIYVGRSNKIIGFPNDQLDSVRQFIQNDLFPVIPNYLDFIPDTYLDLVDFSFEKFNDTHSYVVICVPSYEWSLVTYNQINGRGKTVFVREGGRNLKYTGLEKRDLIPPKRLKYSFLQPIRDEVINGRNYSFINIDKPVEEAYKYMSLEAFILSMVNKSWQFVEPKKWPDKYEGRFYNADYENIIGGDSTKVPMFYATCITKSPVSEAAWKVYSHGQGLSSRCVQIKLDMNAVRKQINGSIMSKGKGKKRIKGKTYEGNVYYGLSDTQIDNIHKSGMVFHDTFFSSFSREMFLKLLLIKRSAYSYEDEIRLFFVPEPFEPIEANKKDGRTLYICVDWKSIIKEIKVDGACSDAELEAIHFACESTGLKLHMPDMVGRPASDEIRLVKFNVDEMKGKKRITIERA